MLDRCYKVYNKLYRITYDEYNRIYKAFNMTIKTEQPIYADTFNELINLLDQTEGDNYGKQYYYS